MSRSRQNTLFSIYIPLIPILSIYISPISSIDLATFCMILFSPIVLTRFAINKKPIPLIFLMLLIYLGIVTGLSLITEIIYSSTHLIIVRTGKFIFLVFIGLLGIRNDMVNYQIAVKVLKITSIIASVILILQFVSYRILGFSFSVIIRPLTVIDVNRSVEMYYNVGSMFRPSSIFLEPSHFFQYVVLTITLILFSKEKKNRGNLFAALIITIAVLLSTSGMGFVVISFLWAIWYLLYIKDFKTKKHILNALLIFYIIMIAIPLLMNSNIVNQTTSRLFTTQVGANAIDARTVSYNVLWDLPLSKLLFGNGYGNILPEMYFSSMAYTIWTSGIIGAALVFVIFASGFFKGDRFAKIFFIVYFTLVLISSVFIATNIVFYFAYLFSHEKSKKVQSTLQREPNKI
ncbi:hypothetical protein ACF5W4_17495 [Bacillota bacterium Lsc_1132]